MDNSLLNPSNSTGLKKQAGFNSFVLKPTQWIKKTNAIGIISKAGRYGGTYAHKDIAAIAGTYHNWRKLPTPSPSKEGNKSINSSREGNNFLTPSQKGNINSSEEGNKSLLGKRKKSLPREGGSQSREGYRDIPGFCNSASIEKVRELDYVVTPGRYVGLPDNEDDFDFNERFTTLKTEFKEQLKEEERLNKLIAENLKKVKING